MRDEFITVPLTKGEVALISPEDSHLLQYSWHVCTNRRYACRTLPRGSKPSIVYMHREVTNAPSGMDVDHINRKNLDNRRCNLRITTRGVNNANGKMRQNNRSGYRGVGWAKREGMWRARIRTPEKEIHIGYFTDPTEAARAYDAHARRVYGDNTYLNFP